MNKALAVLFACVAATAALAHPHGDDEFESRTPVFDCSEMAGDYAAGPRRVVTVASTAGKVTFSEAQKTPIVGDCLAPLVSDGSYLPRAHAVFGTAFGSELAGADCCTVHLKGENLIFDKTAVTWQRRK